MKIEVRKFGEILTSRPAGREAAMSIKAYFKPKSNEKIELDFSGVLAVGPSWMDEVLSTLREEYGEDRVTCLPSKNASVLESLKIIDLQRDCKN
ncbi:MAG: STAS-like domain-containing protein [Bdellovibrio sp.]|nr:STAS-like domain-containing protein [Bdellovibrio sp.]